MLALLSDIVSISLAKSLISNAARSAGVVAPVCRSAGGHAAAVVGLGVAWQLGGSHSDIYNVLWAVVFGFATLNILSLAARRFEPTRRGMTFGELMAVMVVLISVFLLGWEMLNMLHIFPIRLRR
ncbi:MAG: hypothetical protein WB729_05065 [Candidatus Sulfotelmatobacter sp.]